MSIFKKHTVLLILTLLLTTTLLGCSANKNNSEISPEDVTIRIGGLSGPTSMGLVKLMKDSESDKTKNKYQFSDLSTDPSALVAPIAKEELDIAAMPSNLASAVYNNTSGEVEVLAVNTLGVLELVVKGDDVVNDMSDLKDKTIYATGKGATPEYIIDLLLEKNNIKENVEINWVADTTQMLSLLEQNDNMIAILPQPFVTVASSKIDKLTTAFSLNDEWTKYFDGEEMITGVIVARKEFITNYPNAVKIFMEEYKDSIDFVNTNKKEASELIEEYIGINSKIAQKSIKSCNIVFESGKTMKDNLSAFLTKLYEKDKKSIGEELPKTDFYYNED